ALATLAGIVARDHQPGRENEARLERFMKHKPPTFTREYNPEGAVKWLEEVDKTTLGAYMLREEANHWWKNA
ncbi:hypothetical protein A2U01_0108745, partial [Trifolium medium]|nr:hypothetical protein [Trifolium medium]